MKNFRAITNTGRAIEVKARTYTGAWKRANTLAGSDWIVEMSEGAA
jgi:hypothetical protein